MLRRRAVSFGALCALALLTFQARVRASTEAARDSIVATHAAHPEDLHEALEADGALRASYIGSHLELSQFSQTAPEDDPERADVYEFCRKLINNEHEVEPEVEVEGRLYFDKGRVYDQAATPTMAYLRERLYRTWKDCLPLTPARRTEIATVGGFSSPQRALLETHSVLIMDNSRLDAAQLAALDRLLTLVPAALHDLAAIAIEEFLGVRPPELSWWDFFDGKGGEFNTVGEPLDGGTEPQFPDDVPPGIIPYFLSFAAHELNHIVETFTVQGDPVLAARRDALLEAAGEDHMNYLRSMFEDGYFYSEEPWEFFASIANEWFADSAKTVELGVLRDANWNRREPINQALLYAEVYSLGTDVTLFYYIDRGGWLHRREVPLTRDANGHIDSLRIGPTLYQFTLDEEGNVLDVASSSVPSGPVLVKASAAAASPDGASWDTAFPTVQQGLNAAFPGEEVWVAADTYAERIHLKGRVALYGGFAGNETSRGQRDWQANVTILDGGHAGSVVTAPELEGPATRIDGFTIRNGNAWTGGGIYFDSSSPTIANNTIVDNTADFGGGIFCRYAAPLLRNNTIAGNTASFEGGGVCCHASATTLANNTIVGNAAAQNGGGIISAFDSSTTVTNSILWDNTAAVGPQLALTAPTGPAPTLRVDHSDVQGGKAAVHCAPGGTLDWDVPSNLDVAPAFADPGHWDGDEWVHGDYHLTAASECIDAGDDTAVAPDATDLDGDPRIGGAAVDIGADEYYQALPPGPLAIDTTMTLSSALNPNAPAPRSLGILGIEPNGNAPSTRYAIQIGDAPGSGWLRFVNSGPPQSRDDAFPTGTEPEWHTAAEWAGIRLRGLEPDTSHTFHARARNAAGEQSSLADVGTYATSKDCDVNRSGRATVLDYAHIKQDVLNGGTLGVDQAWPCDVDGDGLINVGDLNDTRFRIFHP